MNGPHQKFDLTLDDMVDAEIQDWLEERDQPGSVIEPEQLDLIEEDL